MSSNLKQRTFLQTAQPSSHFLYFEHIKCRYRTYQASVDMEHVRQVWIPKTRTSVDRNCMYKNNNNVNVNGMRNENYVRLINHLSYINDDNH